MLKLADSFPILTRELSESLGLADHGALAEQIDGAVIKQVTFDENAPAAYIYVAPSLKLNLVEERVIGVRHGETIEVETQFWTNIDTDNFGRVVGIEILHPEDLKAELRRLSRD